MLSCIVTLSSVFYPTCISKLLLSRKEASIQAYKIIQAHIKWEQASQTDIHIARTITKQVGSHHRFDCLSKSSVRAVFARNLAITRLRWSRWGEEVRIRPHSSYPWPGRASDKGAWVQNGGTLLRSKTLTRLCNSTRSWVCVPMHQHTAVWAEGRLTE